MLRTLPVRIEYIDGETLRSYVNRLAMKLRVPVRVTLLATGLHLREEPLGIAGFGMDMSEPRLRRFCHTTGLTETQARGLLLRRFDQVAFDLSAYTVGELAQWRGLGKHTDVLTVSSHACPRCLQEDAAWRLHWRFPWSFCCPRHECLLIAFCPGCEQRTHLHNKNGMQSPYGSIVPRPGRCENPPPPGRRRIGLAQPCGFDLTGISPPDAAEVVPAQRKLLGLLDGAPGGVAGSPVAPLQFLRDLRCVAEIVFHGAAVEDITGIPGFALETLERYQVQYRQAIRTRQPGRNVSVAPLYEDPAFMSVLMTCSLQLLDEPSPDALADRLVPLIERGSEHRSRPFECWRPDHSPALRLAVDSARSRVGYARFASRLGVSGPGARALPRVDDLESRHVPQAFWVQPYRQDLAHFLPGVTEHVGRMLCSMLLVRLIEPDTSWAQAATLLGLGAFRAKVTANNVFKRVTEPAVVDELGRRLRTIAQRQGCGEPVDYRRRRMLLADWRGLSERTWQELCAAVGLRTRAGARQPSVWIWADATMGYYKHCPLLTVVPAAQRGVHGRDDTREIVWRAHQYFVHSLLPTTRPALHAVSASLLAGLEAGRVVSDGHLRRVLVDLEGRVVRPDVKRVFAGLAASLGSSVQQLLTTGGDTADRDLALLTLREITCRQQMELGTELGLSRMVVGGGCRRAIRRLQHDDELVARFRELVVAHGGPPQAAIPQVIPRRSRGSQAAESGSVVLAGNLSRHQTVNGRSATM